MTLFFLAALNAVLGYLVMRLTHEWFKLQQER